jgi:hypothetical protein
MSVDPVLCLVKGDRAYFTTSRLEDQWGDDWNDSPYECNAGTPYPIDKNGNSVEITEVVFDSDLLSPCAGKNTSGLSVEMINDGSVSWLRSPDYDRHVYINIFAGCTLSLFIQYIRISGGRVFTEVK